MGAMGRSHSRLLTAVVCAGGIAALAGTTTVSASASGAASAYSTASITAGHAYRHGAVPARSPAGAGRAAASVHALSANNLSFGGGISGVGVTTGAEKVYLVFWGSQWGTQGTNGAGNFTYSGDPSGVAPDLQAFFKGLGTGSETWSGVMTQYCQGVSVGTQTCPSGSNQHVGYPSGGALAGVWEDTSSAAPAAASGHQIGVEGVNAATHFGNTTQASNLNTQYVVVSPTGTNPDNYFGNYCAWHDYTGDGTLSGGGAVSSPDGQLAFTNMPYVVDMGASCGENFVNGGTAGTLDGVTIVEGHEYAETITDQFPAGGWTDSVGNETGDKCAWISSGQGAAQNISLTTGSFAVQSTWANDYGGGAGGCEVSHPIVSNGNTVTVTNPGSQSSTVRTAANLQMQASDSASGQSFTWSAAGLPPGLSINSSTGLISGTPSFAGTYSASATATDTTGAFGSASFSWTVTSPNTVTVTSPGAQTWTVGTAVSLQISASDSDNTQTLSFGATGLPAGLSISSAGLISGKPTSAGASSATVKATDTTGATGSASFSWTVKSVTHTVTVTNPGNQATKRYAPVSLQISASDSMSGQTLSFTASSLPRGLSISKSGLITGKPTRTGTWKVTVTATDGTGTRGSATFTWTIN